MEKKIWFYSKLLLGVLIIAAILITIGFLYKNQSDKKDTKNEKLEIALVNEDDEVKYRGKHYNLGEKYIKSIEKDTSNNWHTVPRSLAEYGLKNGDYQLMIVIPKNFSKKVMSLNEVRPDKVEITYKISASGNKGLEAKAEKVGNQIINSLNQKLVDVYLASILDNLYTAQQNVKTVMDNQNKHIGIYKREVFEPAVGFKDDLKVVIDRANSSVQSNRDLSETLQNYIKDFMAFEKQQREYQSNLEKVAEKHKEDEKNYAEFAAELLAMNEDLLDSKTDEIYTQLQEISGLLQEEFSDNNTSLASRINQLDGELKQVDQSLLAQNEALQKQLDEYELFVQQAIKERYELKAADDEISVEDFIKREDTTGITTQHIEEIKKEISDKELEIFDHGLNALEKLPFLTDEDFNTNKKYFDFLSDNSSKITAFSNDLEKRYTDIGYTPIINVENRKKLIDSYNALDNYTEKISEKQNIVNFTVQSEQPLQKASFNFNLPYDVVVDDLTIAGVRQTSIVKALNKNHQYLGAAAQVNLPRNFNVKVFYHLVGKGYKAERKGSIFLQATGNIGQPESNLTQEKYSTNKAIKNKPLNNSKGTISGEQISPNDSEKNKEKEQLTPAPAPKPKEAEARSIMLSTEVAVNYGQYGTEDYQKLVEEYGLIIGKILADYETADKELDFVKSFYEDGIGYFSLRVNKLLKMNIKEYLEKVSSSVLMSNLKHYQIKEKNDDILAKSKDIQENQLPEINEKMINLNQNINDLQINVEDNLAKLDFWREKMSSIMDKEGTVSDANQSVGESFEDAIQEMSSLLSDSESIRMSAENNADESQSVVKIFDDFNREVADVTAKSNSLADDASKLEKDFKKQLKGNKNFVSTFSMVMGNAHDENGVKNNELINFLSKPVTNIAGEGIPAKDRYSSFAWILIIAVISIFTGYGLSLDKVQMKADNMFNQSGWIFRNIPVTLITFVISMFLGLALGLMSSSILNIPIDVQLNWIFMFMIFTIFFTLLSRYLTRQFKLYGIGILLIILTSYVFLSDAVGQNAMLNDIVNYLNMLNPLYNGDRILNNLMYDQRSFLTDYLIVFGLTLVALFANLFIWSPNEEPKGQTYRGHF